MRVHRSVPWPGPPRERVKSVSRPRGYPSLACHSGPPTPSSAAQQLAARSSQRSAAVRSAAQSIALSDLGSAATVKEVDRQDSLISESHWPTSKAAHPVASTTSTTTGRPAPAALPVQCYITHLNNHPRTTPSRAPMVNWDEAGKTWPQPHPHAARLLRGLLWGQQYRHSNPQCEGGMPGSFELREDMGEDHLRAVKEWLRAEGYEYRFRRKRWRTWTCPDRPGEGLRPDGIEEDEKPNEYPSGASINVSMWDMIEKKFPELGNERRLQGSSSASPGKEKRSAGDRRRDRKWRVYQESLAAEAAQGAKGGTPAASPQRASGGHHPGHTTLGDLLQVAKHAKAKPRQLLLRKSGPSSDVECPPREDAGRPGQLRHQRCSRPKGRGARL